jgi:hypothetical protein
LRITYFLVLATDEEKAMPVMFLKELSGGEELNTGQVVH